MTDFVEVKTAELTGRALDYAVAKAEGAEIEYVEWIGLFGVVCKEDASAVEPIGKYSTDWSIGGPLIEKHRVGIYCDYTEQETITANVTGSGVASTGPTFLIAACRAIVASVLGETVSVPKELMP